MRITQKTAIVIGIVSIIGCGERNSSAATDTVAVQQQIDPKAKGGNTCLLAYAEKYDELLTKEIAAEATGFPADRAIVGNRKAGWETKEHDHVQYEWENGREKLVKQINRKAKARDFIQLTGIKAISLAEFQLSYRAVTDKDMEKTETAMDDASKGKSDGQSEAFRKAQKKLDDLSISREQQKDMMKSFASSAKKMTEAYSHVEQLGDAAVWNSKENRLYIFADGAKFEIVAEIGEDGEKNKAVAMSAAKRILEHCD